MNEKVVIGVAPLWTTFFYPAGLMEFGIEIKINYVYLSVHEEEKVRKYGKFSLKYLNSVIPIFVLFILTTMMSACESKTGISHTYRTNTGDTLIVSLDTTGGYNLVDDYGDFIVRDRNQDTIVQGSFNPEETFNETYSVVKGDSDYTVLGETGESLTYAVYGSSGWETNRIIRLRDAKTTIVMGSLYEDSKVAVDAFDSLTFEIDDKAEQPGFFDRKVMGISMKVVVFAVVCILLMVLAVIIFLMRRKSMEFEYFYSNDEMDDSMILRDIKNQEEDNRLTQKMFKGGKKEIKREPKKEPKKEPHIEVVLHEIDNRNIQYTANLREPKKVGRSASKSEVVIQGDKAVSREHCSMWEDGGDVYIRNLSDTNWTAVNGDKISGDYRLVAGDKIQIGKHEYSIEVKKYDD